MDESTVETECMRSAQPMAQGLQNSASLGRSLGTSAAVLSSVGGSWLVVSSLFFSLKNALCLVHKTFSMESRENNAKEMVETCVWDANAHLRASPI